MVIGTKWVFKNKLDENGVVSRNKARLVAQGYNQQEGIDFDETYAPIARLESIRILLAYACANDFKLFQMDIKSALLNVFINEEVYVLQPPGFVNFEKPNHVYKLKKGALNILNKHSTALTGKRRRKLQDIWVTCPKHHQSLEQRKTAVREVDREISTPSRPKVSPDIHVNTNKP
ncbi:copia protein [Tanacetum coccineum]